MVPAALRRELLQVDPDPVIGRRGLDEPCAFRVHRVVARGIGEPTLGGIEPEMMAWIVRMKRAKKRIDQSHNWLKVQGSNPAKLLTHLSAL